MHRPWILARAGLLDGLPATSRKEPDRAEAQPPGMVPGDRLAALASACRVSRARGVDAGRVITAAGISAGMEMGFHLLRRAGYDEAFIDDVARVMEYTKAYEAYRDDRETAGISESMVSCQSSARGRRHPRLALARRCTGWARRTGRAGRR